MSIITTYHESVSSAVLPTTTNLHFWFKASEGVTKDGSDRVSQWNNKVTGEPHLIQSTGADQLLFVANQLNGKPILRGDGLTEFMQTLDRSGGILSQPNSCFIVFKMIGGTGFQVIYTGNDLTNENRLYWQTGFMRMFAGSVKFWVTADPPPFANFKTIESVFDGASSVAYENKTQCGVISNVGAAGLDGITLFALSNGALNANAEAAEILYYNDIKSGSDRNDIYTYFNNEYGIFFNSLSVLFGGGDEYVNIDSVVSDLSATTKGTWSAWVKPVDAVSAVNSYLLSFSDTSDDRRLSMLMNTDGKLWFIAENVSIRWSLRTDGAAFADDTWAHIAVVQDGVSPVLYINGVAVAQTFLTSTDKAEWFNDIPSIDNGRMAALKFNGGVEQDLFNGNIDEVSLWDDELSAAEILEIHNLGAPSDLGNHSKTASLVSWWKMGDGDTFPLLADNKGSNNATMVNMEAGDIEADVPV